MEYYKGYVCVTREELIEDEKGPAIMSTSTYQNQVTRKRMHVVRQGKGLGNYALIAFDSLPSRFKAAFVAKWGNPHDVVKARMEANQVTEDVQARHYFTTYKLAHGDTLDELKIEEYTMNASVLNEIIRRCNETKSLQNALGGKKEISQKDLTLQLLEKFALYPGHSLPSSWARVSQKIRDYKKKGYEALIQGYVGNQNSVKITEEMGKQIIALKRCTVPRRTNDQIFTEVNRIALEKGWKPLKSKNSLVTFLNRPEVQPQWYDALYGGRAAKQKFERKHKTDLPQRRDSLWYGDGTKLNLYYQGRGADGRRKLCTTGVYEVIDAYSEVLLGYHISDHENYEAQQNAFRMAVESAQVRPFEIVVDNQGGHKRADSKAFFDRIARVARNTAPHNGSSKTIESVFGRFQAQVLYQDMAFTGMNVTSKSEVSKPNLEQIQANLNKLKSYDEMVSAYVAYREEWNNAPHPATGIPRIQMYQQSLNEELQPLTQTDMVDMFWKQTEKAVTYTTSGIRIQVDNQEYEYEVYNSDGMPDLNFRRNNTYRKFVVKYDPQDMTTVRLYVESSLGALKFVAEASPYIKVHRALQDQTKKDKEFIRRMDEDAKTERAKQHIEMVALEMEHGVALEQHGYNRPAVAGISKKQIERYMDKTITPTHNEEPIGVGPVGKAISNLTHDNINGYDQF